MKLDDIVVEVEDEIETKQVILTAGLSLLQKMLLVFLLLVVAVLVWFFRKPLRILGYGLFGYGAPVAMIDLRGEAAGNAPPAQKGASLSASPKICNWVENPSRINGGLRFNEIAWMGNVSDADSEWIELVNDGTYEFNMSDTSLITRSGSIRLTFPGSFVLHSYDFLLLVRAGSVKTLSDLADIIYKGALRNDGDDLRLLNSDCEVLDEIISTSSWQSGSNKSKQTMEFDAASGAWVDSLYSGGTPGLTNSPHLETVESGIQDIPSPVVVSSFSLQGRVYIESLLVGLEGAADVEFVELKNYSSENLNLQGLSLRRVSSGGKNYILVSESRFHDVVLRDGSSLVLVSPAAYNKGVPGDIVWSAGESLAYKDNSLVLVFNDEVIDIVSWDQIEPNHVFLRRSTSTQDFQFKTIN